MLFFRKALKEIAPEVQYCEVHGGEKLIELLESYLPDLLFPDLAMPCKNAVHKGNKENKAFNEMPVIVFTISSRNNAIQTAYGSGANLFVVKPQEHSSLVLHCVKFYQWNGVNQKQ